MKSGLQPLFLAPDEIRSLPSGWSKARVEDLSILLDSGRLYDEKSVRETGTVPVLNQAAEGFHGFHDDEPGVLASRSRPVSTFANHTCAMRLMKQPFSCIQNIFPRVGKPGVCDTVFLHYATLGRVPQSGYKGHHPLYRDAWIPFPSDIGVQRRIAATIAEYDDLIENNRRRMELLEEAVRLVYREWFVRLRFPGHERVSVTKGVPEGWERKTLGELCFAIDYGYTATASESEVGPRFLRITDIVPASINWAAVPFCEIEDARLDRFRLEEGDIVVARTGATVGYAKRLNRRHPTAVFASYLVRFRLKRDFSNLLVGVFVESNEYKAYVLSRVGGAAQPNANARVLAGVEMLVPPSRLQIDFDEIASPMIDEREILACQNIKLRSARDLLLPRLMSGEIQV